MSRVAVIGDIIIDKYIYGTSTRLSPEAPIPIITKQQEFDKIGGAGNVYENLKSLNVNCDLIDLGEPKSIKTRVFCDNHYVTRIDQDFHADGECVLEKIKTLSFIEYDYVILSDYAKGTLDCALEIIEHINSFGCKIIVDPKRDARNYLGAWLVKPNKAEFEKFNFSNWLGNIVITDSNNPVSASIDNCQLSCNVTSVDVSDVTGAGDCFVSAFVYGLVKNYDYQRCLEIATRASTESVKHVGTYILKESDVKNKVIFTNGCFDILHVGHLTLLQQAQQLGDTLIVGLNSDASVKRLKGDSRPVNDQTTRQRQLEMLSFVDQVIIFDDDTPYELIKKIKPDVIVKGGDYTVDQVVGNDLATVHIIPTVGNYSTTHIINHSK
jgi:D-beta-D-heptose 7-phosphate kinase/D-beta-D-heptose 1-phosphate adenosyltransferase